MTDYEYVAPKYEAWFTQKESAFRTPTGGADKDAFDADQVVYPFPISPQRIIPFIKRNKVYEHTSNIGPDYGYIAHTTYGEGKLVLSGPLLDFSLMYFLCKACTTAGGPTYTHTYVTTTARTSTVPSFGMVVKASNDTAANELYFYYFGCVVQSFSVTASVDKPEWNATITILYAYSLVTDAAFTSTEPARSLLQAYSFDRTAVLFKKATVDCSCNIRGFTINYDDGTVLNKAANDLYPGRALHGWRKIDVSLTFMPKDRNMLYDFLTTELGAATASDLDITITATQVAVTNILAFTFQCLWNVDTPEPQYDVDGGYRLSLSPKFIIKPIAFEADAKLTIVETNLLANTRYEGA
jgi:hypothetical protein